MSGAGRMASCACLRRRARRCEEVGRTPTSALLADRQTSITAGTVMHRSKLPLTVWSLGRARRWLLTPMACQRSSSRRSSASPTRPPGCWCKNSRRSMVDPEREPLEGVVEVDQAEIPFRADDSFFNPVKSGKILIAGAVEVIDRGANQAKPRRKGQNGHSEMRVVSASPRHSGQLRPLPWKAFVRANVNARNNAADRWAPILPRAHRDYRHRPADESARWPLYVVLPWIHRVFALMKAVGARHLPWPAPKAHRHLSQLEFVFRYNRRFYRHVSFETVLGLASHRQPTSYWDRWSSVVTTPARA